MWLQDLHAKMKSGHNIWLVYSNTSETSKLYMGHILKNKTLSMPLPLIHKLQAGKTQL